MGGVGGLEDVAARGVQLRCSAEVDGGGGHQPDAAVAVFVVVPVQEPAAMSAGVLDRVEPFRELGPVFQGLELRLRVGVVAGGVRAAVRLGDAEIGPSLSTSGE